MKLSLAHTLRHYDKKNIGKDILAGLIIMAVSIPISMGYALIAGLPVWVGVSDSGVRASFNVTTIYIRRGCGSGSTDWFCTFNLAC